MGSSWILRLEVLWEPTLSLMEMVNMRMAPVVSVVNRLAFRLPLCAWRLGRLTSCLVERVAGEWNCESLAGRLE